MTGASDEARTRYLHLGKVALYQMSYTRVNKSYYTMRNENVNKKIQKTKENLQREKENLILKDEVFDWSE